MKQHRPWPYPRNKEQVVQVVMVTLALLFIGLIGTAAQTKHYKNKPLIAENTQEAATSLSGYASEAALLTDQVLQKHSPQNYQKEYLEALGEQIDSITNFIDSHQGVGIVGAQAQQVSSYGHQLKQLMLDTANQSQPEHLRQARDNFKHLQNALQSIGDST